MKKILMTGGSGAIGTKTIPLLKEEGYEVDNYDVINDIKDDIWNEERLQERMKGKDVVYHLVGIPAPNIAHEKDYWHLNHEGTKLVFQCAKKAAVKKFIFASSINVYGVTYNHSKPDKFPVSEDNYKPDLGEGQTVYGAVKIATEGYLEKESKKAGIRTVALRIVGIGAENSETNPLYRRDHFFATSSLENYQQLLKLVIEKDLDSFFEAFNTGDEYVSSVIDVQEMIKKYWPTVPNYTKDNEALYSIEKAKRLLGYKPDFSKRRRPKIGMRRRIARYIRQRLYKSKFVRIILGE